MSDYKRMIRADACRFDGKIPFYLRKLYRYLRKCQTAKNPLSRKLYFVLFFIVSRKRGVEINPTGRIGEGLYLGHVYDITVNAQAVIGKNCNLHKGVTIGQENRGKREGAPTIGDRVWIGVNATVVGRITIGDDVLIAPNSYVNCDVPAHSIVLGNPCVIKHRENATEDYIKFTAE
ncbi:MAG: serine acetyltransferase [Clostridia bacterium]|nr:serine acetyltransferase [Clostridia bacterium]